VYNVPIEEKSKLAKLLLKGAKFILYAEIDEHPDKIRGLYSIDDKVYYITLEKDLVCQQEA